MKHPSARSHKAKQAAIVAGDYVSAQNPAQTRSALEPELEELAGELSVQDCLGLAFKLERWVSQLRNKVRLVRKAAPHNPWTEFLKDSKAPQLN